MSQILFIRHAQTDLAGTFCGHSDPPLNAAGHAQVRSLLRNLSLSSHSDCLSSRAEPFAPARTQTGPFDAIYSSDLRRAVETAAPLAHAFDCPHILNPQLREIDFGDWEGLTWAQIEARDPVLAQRWLDSYPNLAAPNGEPFAAFEQRVLEQVESLFRLAPRRRVAVVTHAGVLRVALRSLLGYSEEQAWELTRPYCSSFLATYPLTLAPSTGAAQ